MLAIAKHAWLRARWTVTAPGDLALLIFAAWSSFVVWPTIFVFSAQLTLLEPSQARPFALAFLILTLWLGAWVIARPVQGRSTGGEARPLPALPIGWLGRAVGEVVAGLLLVLAVRTLTVTVVGWRLFGFAHFSRWGLDFAGSNSLIDGLARGLLAGWRLEHVALVSLLLFPVMLAWLAPARTQTTLSTRSLLVATLAACMPTGLLESGSRQPFVPILAATIGIVLLSLLAMVDFDAGSALRPGARKTPGPLTRPGIDPERRFRRDRWEPQLRSLLLLVAPAFVLLLGGLLLFLHTTRWRIVYPLCIGLALGLLARFYSTPLGVDAFATDRHGGSRSLVGGAYARAWASLPVRPEAVVRAAYLHGLASASIVWLLWTGHGLVAGALGHRLWDSERDLPLLLAIPIAAGLLLCASVGDHFRGMLSALALASFLPAHLFTLTLPSALSGVEWTPAEIAALNVGVLLALVAIGGLPPLWNLRRHGRAAASAAA